MAAAVAAWSAGPWLAGPVAWAAGWAACALRAAGPCLVTRRLAGARARAAASALASEVGGRGAEPVGRRGLAVGAGLEPCGRAS